MKAVTPRAYPAVEVGCWILSIVTSLMASQISGEITWLLLGLAAPVAYLLAVARPLRDKSPEWELRNAVYFNNAARLTLVSFYVALLPGSGRWEASWPSCSSFFCGNGVPTSPWAARTS
ncbi:Uncharacterised protein [Dermatophilus congolensis]|uniref:Uncharacterized protein n=1 Tax=Dermatophilus congolensis TaxID=1863 RepID=A0AA46BNW6_9MICO|nr:Uncharacterised protein [Dermatophilus congolensis]